MLGLRSASAWPAPRGTTEANLLSGDEVANDQLGNDNWPRTLAPSRNL